MPDNVRPIAVRAEHVVAAREGLRLAKILGACAIALRYLTYGLASAKAASAMREPEVENFFTTLIMRVAPKSYAQANAEVVVTRKFLENFSG